MSIKVSKKHGVNPSMSLCIYCGEIKNEIMLLGKLPKDEQAPMSAVFNYDPCDKCKEGMEQGITFFAADENKKPTVKFATIKEESLDNLVPEGEIKDNIRECRKCLMSVEDFDMMFGDTLKEIEKEKKDERSN